MSKNPQANDILLPVATASYPHLFTPRAVTPGATPRYSVVAIWMAEEAEALRAAKRVCGELLAAKYGAQWVAAVKAGQLHWPFKEITGLAVKPGYPEGGTTASASTSESYPPAVFDRYAGPDGKPRQVTDPGIIYPGCKVRVLVRPYLFDSGAKKGVTLGLQAVQFAGDGDRLDGMTDRAGAFTAEVEPLADIDTRKDSSTTEEEEDDLPW